MLRIRLVGGLLEEGDSAVRTSYAANHGRLAEIKAKYDPENRFRLNQKIAPARAMEGAQP